MKMMSTKMCNVMLMIAAMVAMMKPATRFRADLRIGRVPGDGHRQVVEHRHPLQQLHERPLRQVDGVDHRPPSALAARVGLPAAPAGGAAT